ncbi:MAG TPA: GAF domain-containing sensor histidine kinase [Candidatus Limnocylindrales bacterium]|nr:GAF domain-containing sensor histidine kinase [Candidatus Limnocylindrales bacterium]
MTAPGSSSSDRRDQLLDAGLALAADLALPAVLERIVELAVKLTGARYGALGVLAADGQIRQFITVGLTADERAAIGHIPRGKGVLGALIHEARPLRLRRIAEDPRSVGFPVNHPPMDSFLGAPVIARGKVFGNIYLTEKQGADEFSAEDESALVILATQAGVAIENAALYDESRRRERWLEAVRDIGNAILTGQPAETVLRAVAHDARELVGAATSAIVMVAQEGGPASDLTITVADGAHADQLHHLPVPMEGSVSGDVMRTRRTTVLLDASSDARTYQPMIRLGNMGPVVFVPVIVGGAAIGTLAVANAVGGAPFEDEQVRLVETFANQASLALEYARAQRVRQRSALLDERERIARELHDGVIQSLFAVGMGLQAAALRAGDHEVEARLESAVAEIDRAIRDLRNYIFGLRPGLLADRQLRQALEDLVLDFAEKSGVTAVADVDPELAAELAPRAADLVQLTREALSNVGRHAEAATCRVSLFREDSLGVLQIEDDGRGFDTRAPHTGQGMRNVRERVEAIGGRLAIESIRGEGTTVRIILPLS